MRPVKEVGGYRLDKPAGVGIPVRLATLVFLGTLGRRHGFWCCPVPGCGGTDFGFDILPVDPNYRDERGGWVRDDEPEANGVANGQEGPLSDRGAAP